MRVLVTGGTGFLGAHVVAAAERAGLSVVAAARSAGRRVDLAGDPRAVAALVADVAPDVVVNCAGATAGSTAALTAANLVGVDCLLGALRSSAPRARLVHFGSAAEYGRGEPGVPVGETVAPQPVGAYGVTKLAGTRLVELARDAGLDAVVLRVFNPVGPGAPAGSLPGRLVAALRLGGEVRLGPLDAVRDFVDARDVADAALAAALAPALPHPVLNVGCGRGTPVRALVKELVALAGHAGVVREDAPGSPRSADVPWQQADIALARADLGWRPRRPLAVSLADLWAATP